MSKVTDTIAAISTPQGVGGIAVVRVSGPDAVALVRQYVRTVSDEPNRTSFGVFRVGDRVIDEVVVSTFRAPRSYTGEDVVEISCHGSRYVQEEILRILVSQAGAVRSARLAEAGEFTRRAFLNGRFDLSQAEAVADLIESHSEASHRLAVSQLRGGYSRKLREIRDKFVELTSLLELELDFSDEDVEFADRRALRALRDELEGEVSRLVASFRLGNAIKNGVPVAIVGRPNVGKSTLLNSLLNEERAIVSDIAGTTRDTVEDVVSIDGIAFRFIDTAGIRHSSDIVESAGIERSYRAMADAQIVLYMVDAVRPDAEIEEELDEVRTKVDFGDKTLLLLKNKADKVRPSSQDAPQPPHTLAISAKEGTHIDTLRRMLVGSVREGTTSDATLLTNVRHCESMTHVLEALTHVGEAFDQNLPADLVVVDIRDALYHLGQITGQVSSDEVLGTIFSRFCIGK